MTPFRWFLTALSFCAMVGGAVWVVAGSWKAGGGSLGLPLWAHLVALGIVGVELVLRESQLSNIGFRVELTPATAAGSGPEIVWVATQDGQVVRYSSEPMTHAWKRFKVWLLSLMPIEQLL